MQILHKQYAAQVKQMADQQCKELATVKAAVQNLSQQVAHETALHKCMEDKVTLMISAHDSQKHKYRKLYGQWRQLLATSKTVCCPQAYPLGIILCAFADGLQGFQAKESYPPLYFVSVFVGLLLVHTEYILFLEMFLTLGL